MWIFYASTLGFSIGQAAQIIVGQMMGAGQYEEGYRYMNRVWRYIVASNLFFTITMFLCSRQLMSLLRKTRRLSPSRGSYSSSTLLRLSDVPSTIPRVTDCAAQGYVFVTMLLCVASIWICTVGLGYLFTVQLGLGVAGLYLGIMADEVGTRRFHADYVDSARMEKRHRCQKRSAARAGKESLSA